MHIVFVALEPPYPPDDGGRIRTWNLLSAASREHQVTLLAFARREADELGCEPLRQVCCEVHLVPWPKVGRPTPAERARLLARRLPVASRVTQSPEMSGALRRLLQTQAVDLVHIDHLLLTPFVRDLDRCAKVMNHSDVEETQQRRLLWNDSQRFSAYWWLKWLEHLLWRSFEIRSLAWFHTHLAVSEKDASHFRRHARGIPVVLVPNGVDTGSFQPSTRTGTAPVLVYVGRMDYRPNVDAVLWFCHRILPSIVSAIPEARLLVVGRDPPEEVRRLATAGPVTVTGTVADVRTYYQQAAVAVVPLRAGGGTRLKILEAMAAGVPVVSTTIGCEGLDVLPGRDLLVADQAQAFAARTVQLLNDEQARAALARSARELVVRHYAWSRVAERLLEAYELAKRVHSRMRGERPPGAALT